MNEAKIIKMIPPIVQERKDNMAALRQLLDGLKLPADKTKEIKTKLRKEQ